MAECNASLPSYKHQRGIILTAAAFQFRVMNSREALLVQGRQTSGCTKTAPQTGPQSISARFHFKATVLGAAVIFLTHLRSEFTPECLVWVQRG